MVKLVTHRFSLFQRTWHVCIHPFEVHFFSGFYFTPYQRQWFLNWTHWLTIAMGMTQSGHQINWKVILLREKCCVWKDRDEIKGNSLLFEFHENIFKWITTDTWPDCQLIHPDASNCFTLESQNKLLFLQFSGNSASVPLHSPPLWWIHASC